MARFIRSLLLLALCAPVLFTLAAPVAAQMSTDQQLAASDSFVADDSAQEAKRRLQLLRRGSSYLGPVGGIHVIEAGSGAPGSMRLQLMTDFFLKSDYLRSGDDVRYVGGALSLSVTPVEHLELSAAVSARKVRNAGSFTGDEPEAVKSVGDPSFDVKTYGEIADGVTLGADLLLAVITAPADDSLDYAGMSVGMRGNLSLDLRRTAARTPLELRLNGGYYIDQSAKAIEKIERERLGALLGSGQSQDTMGNDETRQLAYRNERLAYGVNRVDHASVALGLEAPLALSKRVSLHPIAEWELWIPVNRQDYDCPLVTVAGRVAAGEDSCLKEEGASSWPQRVTAGARLYPGLGGLSLLAAVEVGIGGMNHFVRELAPTAPYRVMLAAAYVVDFTPAKEPVKRAAAPAPVPPKQGRLLGKVSERGTGAPVANARVSSAAILTPMVTDGAGQFVSEPLQVGEVQLRLEADGYEPGTCNAQIPSEGGDTQIGCELVAVPRLGTVVGHVLGAEGKPVGGATVQLTGPTARSPSTQSDGSFREGELPPGDYQAYIDHPDHLLSITRFHVDAGKESAPQITLTPKPRKPLVKVQKTQLRLSETVYFNTDTAELQTRSEPLLIEVADALLRTPAVSRVEVQGHTDNVGAPDYNLELSQKRAESVRDFLVRAGVAEERLVAKGYGLTKPIAENRKESGRSKNRRVAFIILERTTP